MSKLDIYIYRIAIILIGVGLTFISILDKITIGIYILWGLEIILLYVFWGKYSREHLKLLKEEKDENNKNKHHLAFVKIDAKANFTESKSITEAVLHDAGVKHQIQEYNHPGFVLSS